MCLGTLKCPKSLEIIDCRKDRARIVFLPEEELIAFKGVVLYYPEDFVEFMKALFPPVKEIVLMNGRIIVKEKGFELIEQPLWRKN